MMAPGSWLMPLYLIDILSHLRRKGLKAGDNIGYDQIRLLAGFLVNSHVSLLAALLQPKGV